MGSGTVFTNNSLERSLSYSPIFLLYLEAFECNRNSDWFRPYGLNQSEFVLHSKLQILEKKTKNVLENGW